MRLAVCMLSLVLLAGCSRDTLDRREWEQMSQADRVIYVKSLIGAEQVKDAKGGGGKRYTLPAEDYVKRIDEAYTRNDAREVHQIFEELAQ